MIANFRFCDFFILSALFGVEGIKYILVLVHNGPQRTVFQRQKAQQNVQQAVPKSAILDNKDKLQSHETTRKEPAALQRRE
jgi:hypothetical protein